MAQIWCGNRGYDVRCGCIGEVPVAREDTLLHRPWTLGVVLEHGLIMVGFDQEGVHAAHGIDDLLRRVTEVGEHGE